MIHETGWKIQMRNGHPEFIPPKWIDINAADLRASGLLLDQDLGAQTRFSPVPFHSGASLCPAASLVI